MDPRNPHTDHPQNSAPASRDAIRSRAWRSRHGQYLVSLLKAAGVQAEQGGTRSHMAQLKKVFASVWNEAVTAAPASMIRHDPSLSRAERRRISSVKNNRLCRHRHHVFLQGVERELRARGLLADTGPAHGPQPSAASHTHHGQVSTPQVQSRPAQGQGHPSSSAPRPAPLPRVPFGGGRDEA